MARSSADRSHAWLLLVGLALGAVAIPFAPSWTESGAALAAYDAQTAQQLQRMRESDVTPLALDEHRAQRRLDAQPLRDAYDLQLLTVLSAVALTLVIVMALEAWLRRLVTARYGLAALYLAFVVAHPTLWGRLPVAFLTLLLAVALIASVIPLTFRRPTPRDQERLMKEYLNRTD